MNDIAIFRNEKFGEIRTTEVNGEPMFCALDVCNVLGYSNPSKAIADHVDNDAIVYFRKWIVFACDSKQ